MVKKARLVQTICFLMVTSTICTIALEEKTAIRLKNNLSDKQYYESFYWHLSGKNPYDEDNWQRIGPKYLMDGLNHLATLLQTTNTHLQNLKDLIKAGKVTIINIDGNNIQKIWESLNHLNENAQLLNINHYQGNLVIVPSATQKTDLPPRNTILYTFKEWVNPFIGTFNKYFSKTFFSKAPYFLAGTIGLGLMISLIIIILKKPANYLTYPHIYSNNKKEER